MVLTIAVQGHVVGASCGNLIERREVLGDWIPSLERGRTRCRRGSLLDQGFESFGCKSAHVVLVSDLSLDRLWLSPFLRCHIEVALPRDNTLHEKREFFEFVCHLGAWQAWLRDNDLLVIKGWTGAWMFLARVVRVSLRQHVALLSHEGRLLRRWLSGCQRSIDRLNRFQLFWSLNTMLKERKERFGHESSLMLQVSNLVFPFVN